MSHYVARGRACVEFQLWHLRQGGDPGCPRWDHSNHRSPSRKRKVGEWTREMWQWTKSRGTWRGRGLGPTVAGFEDGRKWPQAKDLEVRWPRGAGNGHTWWPAREQRPSPTTRRNCILPTTWVSKDTDCLLEPPGRNAAPLIPWFHPVRPCWTADLQNR